MIKLSLGEIAKALDEIKLPHFDLLVAIGSDGIKPAQILQKRLTIPLEIVWINYRGTNNMPIRDEPELTKPFSGKLAGKKILLVDTVARTGKTLEKAKEILGGNEIKTFVINGKADYSLFDYKECIEWPW